MENNKPFTHSFFALTLIVAVLRHIYIHHVDLILVIFKGGLFWASVFITTIKRMKLYIHLLLSDSFCQQSFLAFVPLFDDFLLMLKLLQTRLFPSAITQNENLNAFAISSQKDQTKNIRIMKGAVSFKIVLIYKHNSTLWYGFGKLLLLRFWSLCVDILIPFFPSIWCRSESESEKPYSSKRETE